jgi:hypothetical protein
LDILSTKESKLKALIIRVDRSALIHYKKGKSDYNLINSNNAFISKKYANFNRNFAIFSKLTNEEALSNKARELHAKSSAEFKVIIKAY